MTSGEDASGGAINISGNVVGNVQSGSHARASYRQYGDVGAAPPALSEQAQRLLAAVEEVRERLREHEAELPETAVQDARAALDDVEGELSGPEEPDGGRIRRAVYAVAGALAAVAGLRPAVDALREAASLWG